MARNEVDELRSILGVFNEKHFSDSLTDQGHHYRERMPVVFSDPEDRVKINMYYYQIGICQSLGISFACNGSCEYLSIDDLRLLVSFIEGL